MRCCATVRRRRAACCGQRWPAQAAGLAFTTKQISVAVLPSLALLAFAYEWRRPADAGTGRSLRQARLRCSAGGRASRWPPSCCWARSISGRRWAASRPSPATSSTTPPTPSFPARCRSACCAAGLGLTVSPFRGIFWYSPVLLLGLVGALPFTRRHRWEGLAFLLIVALHILGYSRYLYWSGGVAWGSRYMLPIIPFLLLLAAPVFAWLIDTPRPRSHCRDGLTFHVSRFTPCRLAAHRLEQRRRHPGHPLRLAGLRAALPAGAGQGLGRHRRGHRRSST